MRPLTELIESARLGPNLCRVIDHGASRSAVELSRDDWAFWQAEPRDTPTCDQLKQRMRRQKVSYRKAATALGHPHSYVYEVLNGKRLNPGYRVRLRLAAYLDSISPSTGELAGETTTTTENTKKAPAKR